jgi:hypothetical protein
VGLTGGPFDGPHTIDEPPDPPAIGVNAAADDALVFAIGTLAAGQAPHPHGAGDHHYLGRLSASATLSADEAEAFQEWIVRRAEALAQHPHFAALASAIAEAIERDTVLDEDDFDTEITRADFRYRTTPIDPGPPSRVEEPKETQPMARTAPTISFVQCRESVVAIINDEEKFARYGDIFRADDPLVRRAPGCFVELGDAPHSPAFAPPGFLE